MTIGGFVAGVVFWGAFNTALELTNTETFCTSCHEMHDNVFQELKQTIHFTNRSGVRASCPDCHVPHEWTHKIARKMQASKEVWGKIFGTISTPEKFAAKRRELAEHEWAPAQGQRQPGMPQLPQLRFDGLHPPERPRRPDARHATGLGRAHLHRLPQGHRPQVAGHGRRAGLGRFDGELSGSETAKGDRCSIAG